MEAEDVKIYVGRFLVGLFIVALLVALMIYLNYRWSRIRDVRRQADAQFIIKALDYYNFNNGSYPPTDNDDGDGWDKSNHGNKKMFLKTLVDVNLLPKAFDPINDGTYYYRYQKFPKGEFGCSGSPVVFQVTKFETAANNHGSGACPGLDFTSLAPDGYTWFQEEN